MLRIYLKNASFNMLSQVLTAVIAILVLPFYLRYLSIEGYGVYSFVTAFLQWILFLQMGLAPTVIHLTAKYVAKKEYSLINKTVTQANIFQFLFGLVLACIVWLYSDYILLIILKDHTDYLLEGRSALHWVSITIVVVMCRSIYISALKGLQRYDISTTIEIMTQMCGTLFAVLFVWMGYGIVGMIVAGFMVNLASLIVSMSILKKTLRSFHFDFRINKPLIKEMSSFGSWIAVTRLNRLGINAFPTLLIGNLLGPAGIAYYNIAVKILGNLNSFFASAITVLFPMVSELKTIKKLDKIQSVYLKANKYLSLLSVPFYCFLAIFSWTILNIWVGKEIADNCWLLMLILSGGYYLSNATMVPSTFALGLGKPKVNAITAAIQLITISVSLPILLKLFGIIGAGINYIIFETVSLCAGIYITKKLVKTSVLQFWVKDRLFHCFLGFVIFALFSIFNKWVSISIAGLYGLLYLSLFFVLGYALYIISAFALGIVEPYVKMRMLQVLKRVET